jgi:hypothetical protein
MLDQNFFRLVQVIHEQRIEEALKQHRHQPADGQPLPLRASMLADIGDRLIVLGLKLKAQAAAS